MADYDLIVIGAGPGGYVAAIRAAQLGLKTACIEKEALLGGTCLRVGCIPSKALLESSELFHEAKTKFVNHGIKLPTVELDLAAMLKRKHQVVLNLTKGVEGLLKKNKITRIHGHARFISPGKIEVDGQDGKSTLEAKHIIIATGSKPASLPGVEIDRERVVTSTEALSFSEVPKHLVVIGAGYIGLELGSVWLRLGAKVTVVEYLNRILPGMDAEIATEAHKIFERQGFEFRLGKKVTGARKSDNGAVVECEGDAPIQCDRVLMSVGRIPNTEGLGLETAGVRMDKKGRIEVDPHFATSTPGIYAIGDVIAGPMLAHKAEEEGVACVERIAKGHGHVDYNTIPGVCYTNPEIGSVGLTEEQLKEQGIPFRKGSFPFRANGRAQSLGQVDGRVKILAHEKTDRILGIHIIGPRAGELIAEAVTAMAFGASSEDLARTCHAHPTLPEVIKEAALAVDGRAIHF
ncbi:MAG TPA: dihydrolipoyl dehydrogenase [Candidatus Kapabacteria bacterium]|nr:dihydrolipoyl dehydrogenase [Candidatus Kapabacteria bacterium]